MRGLIILALLVSELGRAAPVAFLSDIEGRWGALETFCRKNPFIKLDAHGRLSFSDPAVHFVFGGDATDRGPASLRVLSTLVQFKKDYPDRVHLIIGNRDLNKLYFPYLLVGAGRAAPPSERMAARFVWWFRETYPQHASLGAQEIIPKYSDPIIKMKFLYARSTNAPEAVEFRRREINVSSDEAVLESLMSDVSENGLLLQYLELGEIGTIVEGNLFVHGALTEESMRFDGLPTSVNPDAGIHQYFKDLNEWKNVELAKWKKRWLRVPGGENPLVAMASTPSPVFSRYPSEGTEKTLVRRLLREGISRVVVGHTPQGQVPTIWQVEDNGELFETVTSDQSESETGFGAQVFFYQDRIEISTRTSYLGDLHYRVPHVWVPHLTLGQKDAERGQLVANLPEVDRSIWLKHDSNFKPHETLHPAMRVPSCEEESLGSGI